MGTLEQKWGPNGDPKTEKGPHGDRVPQMGTHVGTVKKQCFAKQLHRFVKNSGCSLVENRNEPTNGGRFANGHQQL